MSILPYRIALRCLAALIGLLASAALASGVVINVDPGSGRYYPVIQQGLAPGIQQYVDRPFRITQVPKSLIGATLIKTANNDKGSRGDAFLRFEVTQPAMVYVAHDNRSFKKPGWLADFEPTGENLWCDDISTWGFALYRRAYPAGPVVLGGNIGGDPAKCMYSVVVTHEVVTNLPPVPEAASDRQIYWPKNSVHLYGSVSDDARTTGALAYAWSLADGPGPVRFDNPSQPRTRASFDGPGSYRLRLVVSDGVSERYDTLRVDVLPEGGPFDQAWRNAELAQEGWRRSRRFHEAWMAKADPTTGLIPRGLRGPWVWSGHDAAADCYPFMVLSAALTDEASFSGRCLDMLKTERTLTPRLGRLPDIWDLKRQTFYYPDPDLARIQFGASEYVKDGLIAITEWLGPSLWRERMLELVQDCWAYAEVETPFGPIVSADEENNGEMLQVLPRLYWMTGELRYLEWALRLGDYYLLGTNHPTRDLEVLRLRDHGCEVLSGLCELYVTCRYAMPEKAEAYRAPLYDMLDRVLEVGVNPDGFFYDIINPRTGEILKSRLTDTFAYNYNGYYAVYLADGHAPYRDAVRKAFDALPRYPAYNGGETMDGNADALEGALYYYNREPQPALAAWMDDAMEQLWAFQEDDGTINGNYLDGNFARTTLLYALWKTQGAILRPWRKDVRLGATRRSNEVHLVVRADQAWSGRLHFDQPRHRVHLNLPMDTPRINQFSPEWTTIATGGTYHVVDVSTGQRTPWRGEDLLHGLPLELAAGEERNLLLICQDPHPPTRITSLAKRTARPGAPLTVAGVGSDLRWQIESPSDGRVLAAGQGTHLTFPSPAQAGATVDLRVTLKGAGGSVEQRLAVSGLDH